MTTLSSGTLSATTAQLQRQVLETLTGARRYNEWLADLVLPHLGDHPIEVGAGIGTYSRLWLERGVPRLVVSDVEETAVRELQHRFADDARVTITRLDVTTAPGASYSSLVALNVLEHLADDDAGLRGAARLVRPGGTVCILVPAFELAMSRFDRAIGHHRRYTVASLEAAFERAGLRPLDVRYLNAPGLLAWIVGMRLFRLTPHESRAVRLWDSLVVPPTRALEQHVRLPFGQSVLGLANRPVD